jgi:hypothetical protein
MSETTKIGVTIDGDLEDYEAFGVIDNFSEHFTNPVHDFPVRNTVTGEWEVDLTVSESYEEASIDVGIAAFGYHSITDTLVYA